MRFRTDAQRKATFAHLNGNGMDNKFSYAPVYAAADIPAMGVDVAGTAGSTAISAIPLLTTLGVVYVGATIADKTKDRLMRQYDAEKHRKKKEDNLVRKYKKIYSKWGE